MSLVRCQECGRDVSDKALACPGCGWPVREVLAGLAGNASVARLHFNPLLRPGKGRWILGAALIYFGHQLAADPELLGPEPMIMGYKLLLEPWWFTTAGLFLMFWASMRAWYWACGHCGGALTHRKATRCPACLLSLTT